MRQSLGQHPLIPASGSGRREDCAIGEVPPAAETQQCGNLTAIKKYAPMAGVDKSVSCLIKRGL